MSGGRRVTIFFEGTLILVPGSVVVHCRSFSTCRGDCVLENVRRKLERRELEGDRRVEKLSWKLTLFHCASLYRSLRGGLNAGPSLRGPRAEGRQWLFIAIRKKEMFY